MCGLLDVDVSHAFFRPPTTTTLGSSSGISSAIIRQQQRRMGGVVLQVRVKTGKEGRTCVGGERGMLLAVAQG